MKLTHQILMAGAITLSAVSTPHVASATEHIIEMRNKDDAGNLMVFVPGFVKAEVGDTIKFVPTDKGHNAQSVPNIWPADVPEVKGPFSKEVVFKAEKDGLYVFKCLPHYGMGMVALVQIGKPVNLDAVKSFVATGKAKQRLDAEVAKVTP
ncbi:MULTISPECIES: pseudoazurin [unclassified Hyphomicrobium]|uniref:pseudoazurin n=1 Tax=unclassified Hyphomicrobium TaxID=2619925 RepID=UPI000213E63E|nr:MULTISPECIES: pseudoazurin [unclassified Hyphomicrobium]CCB64684.1 Pseudoazurin [Hyphomicrobium sp. MC1]